MFKDEGDFHASVFIIGPNETTVLIRETRRLDPLWKFPGGKKKQRKALFKPRRGEKPAEAAARELFEETGLTVKAADLVCVHREDKGRYRKYYFIGRKNSFRKLRSLSDEYEEVKIFRFDEILGLPGMHPEYRRCYRERMVPYLKEKAGKR